MNYKFEVTNCGSYLKIYVEGTDSLDVSIDFWKRVSLEAEKSNIKKILLLENLTGTLSTTDIFRLNEIVSPILFGLKIAFVDLVEQHLDDNSFGESCANNRGTMISVFTNEKLAENWLKEIKVS